MIYIIAAGARQIRKRTRDTEAISIMAAREMDGWYPLSFPIDGPRQQDLERREALSLSLIAD